MIKNIIRLSVFLLFFVTNAICFFAYQFIVSSSLWLINIHWYRRVQSIFKALFVQLLLTLVDLVAGSELYFHLPPKDHPSYPATVEKFNSIFSEHSFPSQSLPVRDIFIANHQLQSDWIYTWSLFNWLGRAHQVKIILKRSLARIPIVGWSMRFFGFIFLSRNWQHDQITLFSKLHSYIQSKLSFCLEIFPEGTTISTQSRSKSETFASKNHLQVTRNVLLPRVTGLFEAVKFLSNYNLLGIYDVTIGYSGLKSGDIPENIFTLSKMFYQGIAPTQVHFYLLYHPISQVPTFDRDQFSSWLIQLYLQKDLLLDNFYQTGTFPSSLIVVKPISSIKSRIFFIFMTFFSFFTFKIIFSVLHSSSSFDSLIFKRF